MSKGYIILVWDGWGCGLVRINPRLHTEGVDMYENPLNWWPNSQELTYSEIKEKHNLSQYEHYKIILD